MDETEHASPLPLDLAVLVAAIEASSEAILITSAELNDPGPRIEYANPAFARMTGYDSTEVLGRTPRVLQGPRTERPLLDRMRAALTRGESFQGEALNYRKDGSTYMVEWLIAPVRDASGRIERWISAQRDITERRASEDRQNLLVRDLHHRVRNTLATVQAALNASLRSSVSMTEFSLSFGGRIESLSKTHALITEHHTQVVSFEDLLRAELGTYDEPERDRVVLQGPRALLASELAVPVGMALHEMTTNAVHHGALGHPEGRLEVFWSLQDEAPHQFLRWTWNEHGRSPVTLPTREGFEMGILRQLLVYQAHGTVDVAYDPDGLRITVEMPLSK